MSAIFHTRFLLQTQIIKVIDKRKKETNTTQNLDLLLFLLRPHSKILQTSLSPGYMEIHSFHGIHATLLIYSS